MLFDRFRRKPENPLDSFRELLYGDAPISTWAKGAPSADEPEPLASFHRVKSSLDAGDARSAIEALQGVIGMPGLESRQYLQSWFLLRNLGVTPPPEKRRELLGVVVDVGMEGGLDTLAVYADHSARYLNFSGKAIVCDHPNHELDSSINALLQAGAETLKSIGPWEKPRPAPPARGYARISLLTPIGLHFGEGPFELLSRDKRGGPVLAAASQVMTRLIALAQSAPQS